MIQKVFIDSDVILDVALAREPFVHDSHAVLAYMEQGQAIAHISANSVANIYYILRKLGGDPKARFFIESIMQYLNVIPVDHFAVLNALKSKFIDFEDAIQHFSALHHQCELIITRNLADYKQSNIPVMLPTTFLLNHQ